MIFTTVIATFPCTMISCSDWYHAQYEVIGKGKYVKKERLHLQFKYFLCIYSSLSLFSNDLLMRLYYLSYKMSLIMINVVTVIYLVKAIIINFSISCANISNQRYASHCASSGFFHF